MIYWPDGEPHLKQLVTLLVGNGYSRLLGGKAWETLIKDVDLKHGEDVADLPFPEQFQVIDDELGGTALCKVVEACRESDENMKSIGAALPRTLALARHLMSERNDERLRVATTNYDHVLELLLGVDVRAAPTLVDGRLAVSSHGRIIKLHGDACEKDGIVLGNENYVAMLGRLAAGAADLSGIGWDDERTVVAVGSSLHPSDLTIRYLLLRRKAPTIWLEPCRSASEAMRKQVEVRALGIRLGALLMTRGHEGWNWDDAHAEGLGWLLKELKVAQPDGAPNPTRDWIAFAGLTTLATAVSHDAFPVARRGSLGFDTQGTATIRPALFVPGGSALLPAQVAVACLAEQSLSARVALLGECVLPIGRAVDADYPTPVHLGKLLEDQLASTSVAMPLNLLAPDGNSVRHSVILAFRTQPSGSSSAAEWPGQRLIFDVDHMATGRSSAPSRDSLLDVWKNIAPSILFVDHHGLLLAADGKLPLPSKWLVVEPGTLGRVFREGNEKLRVDLGAWIASRRVSILVSLSFPAFAQFVVGDNDVWEKLERYRNEENPPSDSEEAQYIEQVFSNDGSQAAMRFAAAIAKGSETLSWLPTGQTSWLVTAHGKGAWVYDDTKGVFECVGPGEAVKTGSSWQAGDSFRGGLVAALARDAALTRDHADIVKVVRVAVAVAHASISKWTIDERMKAAGEAFRSIYPPPVG